MVPVHDKDLDFAAAEDLASLIVARKLSPTELMTHTLERIAELNPEINAFVSIDEERAYQEASAQTERIARGEMIGPFAGLPLGVKDLEDAEGFITSQGSRAFRSKVAMQNSIQVDRLRKAGAITIGKTNTPEFGHTGFTDNDLFGVTRNPWNLERTPGGSSGGSGAAIAAGMVALVTASDGAGSIRIPASFTGSYGLKPSFGRVPIGPTKFQGWMNTSVYGPLTRTVRDSALYLDQVCGHHPADPRSLPIRSERYLELLDEPLPKLRIAFSHTLGATPVQVDVLREVDEATTVFKDLNHEVTEINTIVPRMGPMWVLMSRFQALAELWDVYLNRRDELGENYARGLDSAIHLGPEEFGLYSRALAEVTNWASSLFEEYDLLITPTMPLEPFIADGPIPQKIGDKPCDIIAFTAPFNFTGHPAATVRSGFTDVGLPVGLQIVGPPHRDDLVLQASYAYERERPWHNQWPDLSMMISGNT